MTQARPGFLLVEALVGFALFAIFMAAVGLTLLVSQQSTAAASNRARAIALSSRALEGVQMIRNAGWSNLQTGTHGVYVQNGQWAFTGSAVTTTDGFATSVILSQVATGRMAVTATTQWDHHNAGSGTVKLSNELTDWRTPKTIGNWAAPQTLGSSTTLQTRLYNRVTVANNTAFVTGDISGGGAGLYLFDVSNAASPLQIATGFSLGVSAHDVVASGQRLYVATEDPAAEIRIYDISDPSNFNAADLLGSYDLPGSGRARALVLNGSTLLVGQTLSVDDPEITVLNVDDPTDPSLTSVIEMDGDVQDLSLQGDALYIATTDDGGEIRVADLSDIEHPHAPPEWGYNLTDVTDAKAVSVAGTGAVLARADGTFVEEGVLFDLTLQAVPATPPGPWYWEAGGSINDLQLDLSGRYAFVATSHSGGEMRVLDMAKWHSGLQPVVATMPLTTGEGRGVFYDVGADRLYMVTQQGLYIYKPS